MRASPIPRHPEYTNELLKSPDGTKDLQMKLIGLPVSKRAIRYNLVNCPFSLTLKATLTICIAANSWVISSSPVKKSSRPVASATAGPSSCSDIRVEIVATGRRFGHSWYRCQTSKQWKHPFIGRFGLGHWAERCPNRLQLKQSVCSEVIGWFVVAADVDALGIFGRDGTACAVTGRTFGRVRYRSYSANILFKSGKVCAWNTIEDVKERSSSPSMINRISSRSEISACVPNACIAKTYSRPVSSGLIFRAANWR